MNKIVLSGPGGGRREISSYSAEKTQPIQTQCIRVDKDKQKRADPPLQSRLLQTIRSTARATLARPRGTYGRNTPTVINKTPEHVMSEVVYVSKSRILRKRGPLWSYIFRVNLNRLAAFMER
jgi:hypothetical protein